MSKKTQGRKAARKVTRRTRKSKAPVIDNGLVVEIDQIYKIINKVQLTRENANFIVRELDCHIVENILKDAEIRYTKEATTESVGKCLRYFIEPAPERKIEKDFEDFDIFPDEIIEDGQVFF
jgi:hypothetical protein